MSDKLKHQAEISRANELLTYPAQGNKDDLINIYILKISLSHSSIN